MPILILYDGETIINNENQITSFKFSKSDFLLKNLKSNTITTTKTQEMKTIDVISCINSINNLDVKFLKREGKIKNCTERNKINITKELYKRLIVPIYIPILMLVPYLLILSSKEKLGYKKLKLTTFFLGVVIIILSEGVIRFINPKLDENLIIFMFPFVTFIFLYFIFIYKLNFKKT